MKIAMTVAAEALDQKRVTIQLKKGSKSTAENAEGKYVLDAYLSSDADGLVVADAWNDGMGGAAVDVEGDRLDQAFSGNQRAFKLVTDENGKVDLLLTDTGDAAGTRYLNVADPGTGKVQTSGPITWADDTP